MSAIIIPRKHYTQPQGRVEIAPEWLDTGLGVCVLPPHGPNNLVTQVYGVNQRTTQVETMGVAARCVATTDAADIPFSALGSRAFTWLTVGKFDAPTAQWQGVAAMKRGTDQLWAVMRNGSQGPRIQFRVLTESGWSAMSSISLTAFANGSTSTLQDAALGVIGFALDASAGAGVGQTVVRQYRDNQEMLTYATVPEGTFDASPAHSFFRAGGNHDGGYGTPTHPPWPQTLLMSLYWHNVAVSSDLVRALQQNPYQIFKADPVRIYSLPPVLTIPELSTPGVIDITASSARPRVTLAY